jgi:hypothetical protein
MPYRLRTLLPRFTLRDLFWLTAVIGLIVVWRCDLAWQEAQTRNRLGARSGQYSPDRRLILHVAQNHPELLAELNAFDAVNNKNLLQRLSLNLRFNNLLEKATDLYKRDRATVPVAFSAEEPTVDPLAPASK